VAQVRLWPAARRFPAEAAAVAAALQGRGPARSHPGAGLLPRATGLKSASTRAIAMDIGLTIPHCRGGGSQRPCAATGCTAAHGPLGQGAWSVACRAGTERDQASWPQVSFSKLSDPGRWAGPPQPLPVAASRLQPGWRRCAPGSSAADARPIPEQPLRPAHDPPPPGGRLDLALLPQDPSGRGRRFQPSPEGSLQTGIRHRNLSERFAPNPGPDRANPGRRAR
jgi:hypothetical protein